ncbi:MAG: sigma-70 family RNA polymerase sigma factor [Pseudomonadota bacterium]
MDAGDGALVARVAAGDERAFNMLIHRHSGFVHALALRYTQSRADADEVAQGVFLSLWRAAARWRETATLRTWLYRVTVNRCIDLARRRRRWQWLTGAPDLDAFADEAPNANDQITSASELRAVRQAMAKLPERQRMALVLVAERELSGSEAADAMDITPGALEQLLVRGRKKLRSILENGNG